MSQFRALLFATTLASGGLLAGGPAIAQTTASQDLPAQANASPFRPAPPSFGDLIAETVTDFRHLPSWESATILSIGAVAAGLGTTLDSEATQTFSTSRVMGTAFNAGETLGSARMQAAAAFATYAVGRLTGHERTAAIGADLVSAQIMTQAMTAAAKIIADRGRPDGTNYSFPSGHSSTAFATATVLQRHLGWKVGIPAYAAATYVALSRIQVERHYLSDVMFGAAVGIVGGRSVTLGRGDATFAMAPAPVPGGAGVSFTLVRDR